MKSDEEIIKALEICENRNIGCEGCPYIDDDSCFINIYLDALNLIKKQQAEIERINAENMLTISERNAFRTSFYAMSKQLKHAKSEAVIEFVEELKKKASTTSIYDSANGCERIISYQFAPETIDNIVKEMGGEK